MIIVVGGRKGGTGKTTIATNLAVFLKDNNNEVILVDADKQSSATRWVQDRTEDKALSFIPSVQSSDNVKEVLEELASKYKYVIVDTPGRDSREQRTAMLIADIILIPIRPSQYDLDTIEKLNDIYNDAKDINSKLSAMVMLSMCPTHPLVKEKEEAIEYLKDFPDFKLLNAHTCDRKIYRDTASWGKGVYETNNKKAISEIKSLANEVLKW